MKFSSIFAGIGGFDRAFELEGMTPVSQVEVSKHRRTVLAEHWPDTPRSDDVCTTSGTDLGRPELVCGGFPCQDTSIAAPHRQGLAGKRSGLYWEFRRLLDEHLRLVDSTRPRWVVIENPPGLLRSNHGRDMAAVAVGLESIGYGWAYRVVDSRRLGSPQRRQRVLVVGHLGGDPRPAAQVLADPEGGSVNPRLVDERRGTTRGPKAATSADNGRLIFRKSRRPRSKEDYATWPPAEHYNTLTGFDAGFGERQTHLVIDQGRPRVLTLTEWERLQGFDDNWTACMPQSERFTALGDAMNVPMARWLARRLMAVDRSLPMIGVA